MKRWTVIVAVVLEALLAGCSSGESRHRTAYGVQITTPRPFLAP
jgi:hypothetical protein